MYRVGVGIPDELVLGLTGVVGRKGEELGWNVAAPPTIFELIAEGETLFFSRSVAELSVRTGANEKRNYHRKI